MSWLEHHVQSERYASQAQVAAWQDNEALAQQFYRQAAEQEELALAELPPDKVRTLGITVVSAAALWFKSGAYTQVQKLAATWLDQTKLPEFSYHQLREIVEQVENRLNNVAGSNQ